MKLILTLILIALCLYLLYSFIKHFSKKSEDSEESSVKAVHKASERLGISKKEEQPVSYGPQVDAILQEGNLALSEMGRLYSSIRDEKVRPKINEIMQITDQIMKDAVEDPSDVPQIKKFFRYYLPTTIKLLNAYDRMDSQEIELDNITKSKQNIYEMLDVAIAAYKKRLDSLFEDQALDIETDIDVMNQMLEREGLTENHDFAVQKGSSNG